MLEALRDFAGGIGLRPMLLANQRLIIHTGARFAALGQDNEGAW
jgi:hypothetical protein